MTQLAHRLNRRVLLQQAGHTAGSGSELLRTYNTIHEMWAEVEDLVDRKLVSAQQVAKGVTAQILVRYDADVVNGLFFSVLRDEKVDRRFKILKLRDHRDESEYMICMCEEIEVE